MVNHLASYTGHAVDVWYSDSGTYRFLEAYRPRTARACGESSVLSVVDDALLQRVYGEFGRLVRRAGPGGLSLPRDDDGTGVTGKFAVAGNSQAWRRCPLSFLCIRLPRPG
jgi:hypothetical protein